MNLRTCCCVLTLMLPASTLVACGADQTRADTDAVRVAYASDLDPTDIAEQFGLGESDAEVTYLTEDSGVVAGLSKGDFDIGNLSVADAIKAIGGGVPLKIVYVSQDVPEFVLVSQAEITEVSQLAGKTVAYHSPGSLTEILPRELVRDTGPGLEDEVNWTVLPESPNRASAMVAGRIDATALEFLDVVSLQEQGEFNIVGQWSDLAGDSADAVSTVWVVTEDFLSNHRDTIVDFLASIQEGYDRTYDDKQAWMTTAQENLPDVTEDVLSQAYDYYVEAGMYPRSGEPPLTEDRWAGLDAFFRQIGEYEQTADIAMVDLDLVSEVAGQ